MMPTSHKILISLKHVLSKNNTHERDQNIKFFEEGHKYVILTDSESKYTSVTTWNHSHFAKFDADKIIKNMMSGKNWKEGHKYWGLTTEQINALWANNANTASGAGTNMHYEIECFMNNENMPAGYTHKELYDAYIKAAPDAETSVEWKYFIQFVKDFPYLKPYRTEWTVYNEDLKLAGSIDMVYENPDGTLSIYDWKRVKEINRINTWNKYAITRSICQMPDSNFWHYSLQLNTYKAILEAKYDKKVTDLYLVRLHPEAEESNYEVIKVPDLSADIQTLFKDLNK